MAHRGTTTPPTRSASLQFSIEDDVVAELVACFAERRCLSNNEAVRLLLLEALACCEDVPLRERFAAWRAAHPVPPPTGLKADKAFFDELSGDA